MEYKDLNTAEKKLDYLIACNQTMEDKVRARFTEKLIQIGDLLKTGDADAIRIGYDLFVVWTTTPDTVSIPFIIAGDDDDGYTVSYGSYNYVMTIRKVNIALWSVIKAIRNRTVDKANIVASVQRLALLQHDLDAHQ